MRRAKSSSWSVAIVCDVLRVGGGSGDDILMLRQERLKEKLLAKQRAANAVHLKEKELSAAEELCSSLKQEIQVCKAATRECLEKVDEVRSRRAPQDTPGMQVRGRRVAALPTLLFHSSFAPGMLECANAARA